MPRQDVVSPLRLAPGASASGALFERVARDMLAAGATWREIGERFGVNKDAARMRAQRLDLRGERGPGRDITWTPERIADVRAMLAGGLLVKQAAHRVGVSHAALRMALLRARAA